MRTVLVGGIAIVVFAGGCAAMHKQTIENMKANGDPRAPCYEACGASDVVCMKECDNKHPLAGTILQGAGSGSGAGSGAAPSAGEPNAPPAANGVTQEQIEMLTAAALQDAARRKAATSTPSSSTSSPSTTTSTSTSSFSSSHTKSSAPSSNMDCNPACAPGQKCLVYLQGSKQCAPGGKCWTVDRTHAECK